MLFKKKTAKKNNTTINTRRMRNEIKHRYTSLFNMIILSPQPSSINSSFVAYGHGNKISSVSIKINKIFLLNKKEILINCVLQILMVIEM